MPKQKYLKKFKTYTEVRLDYESRKVASKLLDTELVFAEEVVYRYKTIVLEVGLKSDGNIDVLRIIKG